MYFWLLSSCIAWNKHNKTIHPRAFENIKPALYFSFRIAHWVSLSLSRTFLWHFWHIWGFAGLVSPKEEWKNTKQSLVCFTFPWMWKYMANIFLLCMSDVVYMMIGVTLFLGTFFQINSVIFIHLFTASIHPYSGAQSAALPSIRKQWSCARSTQVSWFRNGILQYSH